MTPLAQVPPPVPPEQYRLTVQQYHAMINAGILVDDDPVELIDGFLVQKMSKNPPHAVALRLIVDAINPLLPSAWHYRAQEPITLADSEPEPDLVIARGGVRDYTNHHPGPDDIALVVEVADATLPRDRGFKLRCYARGGVQVYWIVNLPDRQIEAYTNPNIETGAYMTRNVVTADQSISLALGHNIIIGSLRVGDVLPSPA